jgi:hypothetical protein
MLLATVSMVNIPLLAILQSGNQTIRNRNATAAAPMKPILNGWVIPATDFCDAVGDAAPVVAVAEALLSLYGAATIVDVYPGNIVKT